MIKHLFLYLHSTVVLLKVGYQGSVGALKQNLHSTVVLLKGWRVHFQTSRRSHLHSTVVLLKAVAASLYSPTTAGFTFYCSSIKSILISYVCFIFTYIYILL